MVTKSYSCRQLEPNDLLQMHRTFLEAFEDYTLNLQLSYDQFVNRILNKLQINYGYSIGAFSGNKLVGFLFHAINYYDEKMMAYNGGTGVIPGHRGNGLTKQMYDELIPSLKENVEAIVLEVLQSNETAINTYRQIGFKETRIFDSFKLAHDIKANPIPEFQISKIKDLKPDYKSFGDMSPSFGDTLAQLCHNVKNELIIEVSYQNIAVGYIVFQPALGRISQLAVKNEFRQKGIGRNLIRAAQIYSMKPLTVMNVNQTDARTIDFLKAIGFNHSLTQFEMQLSLA